MALIGGQEHEDLVAVAVVEAESTWPAADLRPPEPAVELLESFSASCFEWQLLQAHFVTGDLADVVHQRGADARPRKPGWVCTRLTTPQCGTTHELDVWQ